MVSDERGFSVALEACAEMWQRDRYLARGEIQALADLAEGLTFQRLFEAFNGSDLSVRAIESAASMGEPAATELLSLLPRYLPSPPYGAMDPNEYERVRTHLDLHPWTLNGEDDLVAYPYHVPGRTYAYDMSWVRQTLERSTERFGAFCREGRTSDCAILVGNGPSLNKADLGALQGQDVFISNYAIKHPVLGGLAKGVAVSNYLVAEQEPFRFQLDPSVWKFFPFWLRNTLIPDERTIFLNAQGGDLFCSSDVLDRVAWHSTVSFFWLQILYTAGYRKVLMIGFDHSYAQNASAKEGDVLHQTDADENHFSADYFRGKRWQAADVDKMESAYVLARKMFESDGREVVNCTVGGKLNVFRRSSLEAELRESIKIVSYRPQDDAIRVAVITPFWKGDVEEAERHWRLINRLGEDTRDHIYIFKHRPEDLPPVTMRRVAFARIEDKYPDAENLPHPAGPNLVFVETVRMLKDTGFTHFFWMEPDCIPTDSAWLGPFVDTARSYPDEPIVGTGGGSTIPGRTHWKHHFAGCSLYNLSALSDVDLDRLISSEIDVSFDVWLSVALGYITLGEINDEDETETIIYGRHRRDWTLVRRPPSLVSHMFEHWRPGKFLSGEQLRERIREPGFSLLHAIKDEELVREAFAGVQKSVTTIIINYNNGPYLERAIASALDQDISDIRYEVIVVDDGSTDESVAIVNSFGDRIRSVLLEHGKEGGNFNQQRALKAGLELAQGDVILLLDGDDAFHPDKVRVLAGYFDDPDVVLVQHVLRRIDGEGRELPVPMYTATEPEIKVQHYEEDRRCNYFQPTSGLAYRRCYLSHAMRWLKVDRFAGTWLDVRTTRLAPFHGRVLSLSEALGDWRRHVRSDSITDENLCDRMVEHHDWFNVAAAEYGFYVDYESSAQHRRLRGLMNLLRQERKAGAHFDETQLVAKLLADRGGRQHVMLDVGAHIGSSAAYFDAMGWTVFCFEPDASNREMLVQRFGSSENVSIDSRAVSEQVAHGASFYASSESTGISGLLAFTDSHRKVGEVEVTTISDVVEERSIRHIDFLKIDVEGHDLGVLKGVPWGAIVPDVVECEFEDSKTNRLGHSWHDICEYLVSCGYSVYVSEWHPIVRYGIPHDWHALKRYPCELSDSEAWGNLLAFRNDPGLVRIASVLEQIIQFRSEDHRAQSLGMKGEGAASHSARRSAGSGSDAARQRPVSAPRLRAYARLGEYLRRKSPAVFQLGRAAVWVSRFLWRHKLALVLGCLTIGALVLASSSLEGPFRWLSAFLAGLMVLGGGAVLSGAFAHEVMDRRARWERSLRRAVEKRIARLEAAATSSKGISEVRQDVANRDKRIMAEISDMGASVERRIGQLSNQLDEMAQRFGASLEEAENERQKVNEVQTVLGVAIEELRGAIDESGLSLQQVRDQVANLDVTVGKHAERMKKPDLRERVGYQTFNRVFSKRETDLIVSKWLPALGVSQTQASLAYMAERVVSLEGLMRGRLASSIEDAVLRVLVALAPKSQSLEVLEIGALFGVGVAIIYERATTVYDHVHCTLIDPLEGYYGNDKGDVLTGEPISRRVFLQNMQFAGIPEEDFTLLQGYSTEPSILEMAASKTYDLLVIDGDHSYEGVKWDFDSYVDLVNVGGYIIIDDYGNPDWPDVTEFVDKEVLSNPGIEHVGSSWRTAVLRRR